MLAARARLANVLVIPRGGEIVNGGWRDDEYLVHVRWNFCTLYSVREGSEHAQHMGNPTLCQGNQHLVVRCCEWLATRTAGISGVGAA